MWCVITFRLEGKWTAGAKTLIFGASGFCGNIREFLSFFFFLQQKHRKTFVVTSLWEKSFVLVENKPSLGRQPTLHSGTSSWKPDFFAFNQFAVVGVVPSLTDVCKDGIILYFKRPEMTLMLEQKLQIRFIRWQYWCSPAVTLINVVIRYQTRVNVYLCVSVQRVCEGVCVVVLQQPLLQVVVTELRPAASSFLRHVSRVPQARRVHHHHRGQRQLLTAQSPETQITHTHTHTCMLQECVFTVQAAHTLTSLSHRDRAAKENNRWPLWVTARKIT